MNVLNQENTSSFADRLGLALPSKHAVISAQNTPLKIDHLSSLRSLPGVLLAPWKFCAHMTSSIDSQDLIEDLIESVSEKQHKCQY